MFVVLASYGKAVFHAILNKRLRRLRQKEKSLTEICNPPFHICKFCYN